MYNAASRKDIRRAEKASELLEKNRLAFIKAAMGTIEGRVFFHDLLAFCHLFSDPFTGDALREAYSKGERNVGLKLFSDITTHCPDYYISMMREAQIKDLTNERRDDDDHDGESGDDAFSQLS